MSGQNKAKTVDSESSPDLSFFQKRPEIRPVNISRSVAYNAYRNADSNGVSCITRPPSNIDHKSQESPKKSGHSSDHFHELHEQSTQEDRSPQKTVKIYRGTSGIWFQPGQLQIRKNFNECDIIIENDLEIHTSKIFPEENPFSEIKPNEVLFDGLITLPTGTLFRKIKNGRQGELQRLENPNQIILQIELGVFLPPGTYGSIGLDTGINMFILEHKQDTDMKQQVFLRFGTNANWGETNRPSTNEAQILFYSNLEIDTDRIFDSTIKFFPVIQLPAGFAYCKVGGKMKKLQETQCVTIQRNPPLVLSAGIYGHIRLDRDTHVHMNEPQN
jgi:hypothetical protein